MRIRIAGYLTQVSGISPWTSLLGKYSEITAVFSGEEQWNCLF